MPYSPWTPPLLNNDQAGAIPDIIGHLMSGYSKGTHAAYLPKQIEADIFAKKVGPLATLATSPMFLQNPQFQQALSNLLAKNLGGAGGGFGGMGGGNNQASYGNNQDIYGNNDNTYAGQVGQDVNKAQEYAQDLSKKGKIRSLLSSLAGLSKNILGDTGNSINEALGLNSGLAQKENKLIDTLKRLKKTAIDTQALSPADAENIFTQRKNETLKDTIER